MEYRLLGQSGVRVSCLSLGTIAFGVAPLEADVERLVHRAMDAGVNFIDTANSYGNQTRFDAAGAPPAAERKSSEELVGRAIRGRRADVVIATKVSERMPGPTGLGPNDGGPQGSGLTRRHIVAQCEQSLRRLGTDYIDLYYAHHPDQNTPLDQTFRAFDDLVRAGKVRYPAISNYAAWELTRVLWVCDRLGLNPPVATQMPYNLLDRTIEREVVPACLELGVGIVTYTPLAAGLLTGVYKLGEPAPRWHRGRDFTEAQLQQVAPLSKLAAEWGHTPAQLALAWLLSRPGMTSVIVGPVTPEEVDGLTPAIAVRLDAAQLAALDAVGR
jgi:aryl-alcohol dehydrogenase-like predicted oxidoreductase